MNRILCCMFFLFLTLVSVNHLGAQTEEEDEVIVFDGDGVESEEKDDEPTYEYYYDWNMPKYSLGVNLNSIFSPIPMAVLTHDFGLDDTRRIAIETGATLLVSRQQGFKLRGTYQKFFDKNDKWGAYYGFGVNLVSIWEPREETVFLENTYLRILNEVRNQTLLSGLAEIGTTFEFKESQLFEITMGLGVGVQRSGGSFVVIRDFDRFEGFLNRDPGFYLTVPFYFNLSLSLIHI